MSLSQRLQAPGVMIVLSSLAFFSSAVAAELDEQAWREECSACHIAYPARFLTAASWQEMMRTLDEHFGADASVDAVLLLGPLYHLTERADRVRALAEGRRVLRPGGVLAAAAISRYASAVDGLFRGHLREPGFEAIVERDLPTASTATRTTSRLVHHRVLPPIRRTIGRGR